MCVSLLPDRKTMDKVCESVLNYGKEHSSPQIMIPPEYFEQILENGHIISTNAEYGRVHLSMPTGP